MNTNDNITCINRWPKGRWSVLSHPSFSPEHDLASGDATSESVTTCVPPASATRAPFGNILDSHTGKQNDTKPMKPTKLKMFASYCLTGACLLAATTLNAAVAVLELERSTDSMTWTKVALDPSLLTATGGVLQNTHGTNAIYRLKINSDQHAGFVTALTLDDAPKQAVAIAKQFLEDMLIEDQETGGDPEGNWGAAQLGPVCYPLYDPAVDGGRTPAYIEFKVVRAPQTSAVLTPNNPFGLSTPDTVDDRDFGHLRVALTTNDFPVPSFSQSGATPVEMLLRKSRTSGPVKPVRYDEGLLVGEDAAGAIVGSIGNVPFSIDPSILEIAGKEFEGFDEGAQGTQDDDGPEYPARGYESYQSFKTDFATNRFYVELRRLKAKSAAKEWNAVAGKEPESIRVPLSVRTLVLGTRRIQSATVDDPKIAVVNVPTSQNGLWVTGQQNGGTLLEVTYSDGATESFVLFVGTVLVPQGALNASLSGWQAWQYWYAGNWSDQRRYQQFQNDPQMCTGGASGCGPAAWAMLFGWWDRKGAPRLMKSTTQADAPLYNDDSVRDCNRYVFDQVGPFCVSGQAATMPWNMKAGRHWAAHRGAGQSISWKWGLPYLSPGSVSKVADSIKNGRPSILGLGTYWHYPLAYGYKARQNKVLGIVVSTQRYFKCNMGWGGNSAEWHNANSTWFGTHARYW